MNRHKQQPVQLVEWVTSDFIAEQLANLLLVSLLFIVIRTSFLNFKSFIYILFVYFLFTIETHLSALRLETSCLCNLVVHVPCSLFELRCFILYPSIRFKRPLLCHERKIEAYRALVYPEFVLLKYFVEAPNNNAICIVHDLHPLINFNMLTQ